MNKHKHRAMRPLTYRKSLSMARQFALFPGHEETARKHKAIAIRLAHSDAERAKAEAIEIKAGEHKAI